ncbi:MAG: preprotein translocase subunit YajC [Planctomycetes bacterium]|nr:preprotein translocase subunit YajC [Planctomycetota bacterium]
MWMLPAMLVVMWLFVMRPEQKRRKEQQALLSSIKVGDKVVTAGGMHGVVGKLDEKTVSLRIGSTEVTFDRTAIARVERADGAPKAN